jgi:hypothetical protein
LSKSTNNEKNNKYWRLFDTNSFADSKSEIEALRKDLIRMQKSYEARISDLENNLEKNNSNVQASQTSKEKSSRKIYSNNFNPSIGIILNGKVSSFSNKKSEIQGFGVGEEGERGG